VDTVGKLLRAFVALVITVVVAGAGLVVGVAPAQAADPATFDPGYIISDQKFYDSASMTEAQVQAFLAAKLPSCAQANGIACLRDYKQTTVTRAASTRCTQYTGGTNETAARIIVKVAKSCGINPQVLLATLQKEQGLVTAGSPTERQYRVAMGYGCPDTAPCDSLYYGFFNQVYSAASQFIRYGVNPSSWNYHIGAVAVQYHPNAACGAPVVNIRNQATASLYNYTPYQPNKASLAHLGASGDSCSSYGNRNFWAYFTDWFGPTTGPVAPFGSVDVVSAVPGGVRVRGWAIDPDVTAPIYVHIFVDGVGTAVLASDVRSDVGSAYPASGSKHGWDAVLPVAKYGDHRVCVTGINVGPGSHTELGCKTVNTLGGSPTGKTEAATGGVGTITVSGWAVDRDTVKPLKVTITTGSTVLGTLTADVARNDVAARWPEYGSGHGFSGSVTAPAGRYDVCVVAGNVGAGASKSIGCTSVTVTAKATTTTPVGTLETVKASAGAIAITGWTADPDTPASGLMVHVTVDGEKTKTVASISRPDVAKAYPVYGAKHGFALSIAAAAGMHKVCVTTLNTGAGSHLQMGCSTVTL
jgi:hypothetical protein